MTNQAFEIYRLDHSSPNEVFNWLRENKPKKNKSNFDSDREELEKTLQDRNEPLINLGLALFGFESGTGISLFQKGDETIKEAVLSGTTIISGLGSSWVEDSGILNDLLKTFNEELLVPFFSNENIKDGLLAAIYEKKEPFNKLDDESWYKVLWASTENPRIRTPYDKTWMDGFDEYLYGRVFTTAWKLFEALPADKNSAALLAHLGEKLVPDRPHDMDVMAAIKRWRVDKQDKHVDYFELCRFSIARLVREYEDSFKSFKDSDDIALRRSYYCRYTAHQPENVRELFEKDNDKFLDEALNNINFFKKESIRDELGKCCWDYKDPHHDLLYPNIFNSRIENYRKEHPEWFKDWDGEPPLDDIEDPIVKANKQLDLLNERVKGLAEKLFEADSDDQRPLIDEVRNLLTQTNIYLSQLSRSKYPAWGWIIAGFIIGYIIAKLF